MCVTIPTNGTLAAVVTPFIAAAPLALGGVQIEACSEIVIVGSRSIHGASSMITA